MQSETVEQEPPVRRADIDDYDQLIIFVKFIVNCFFSSEVHVVRMEVLENRPLQSSTLRYSLEVASKTDIVISNLICFVYFTFSSD